MVGGASHCVCKKGTIRPKGSTRCVPEQLLQQYINNIIANCSLIQNELIEAYGKQVKSNEGKVQFKEEECNPKKPNACKGLYMLMKILGD